MKRYFSLLAGGVFLLASCHFSGERVNGNNTMGTEEREVGHFNEVALLGSMDVVVEQGPAGPAIIEAEENVLPYIELEEKGDQLQVKFRNNTSITTHRKVVVHLKSPRYDAFKLTGSGEISGENLISNPKKIEVAVTGSGNIRLELDAPQTEAATTGSGDVFLKGNTRDLEARITGSGKLHLESLLAENVKVRTSGSGDASVYASMNLDVRISGSGNVTCRGDAVVESKVTGSGRVRKF